MRQSECRGRGLIGLVTAVLLASGAATAQFSQFQWTFGGDPSGWGSVGETTMHITGPAWEACTTTDYTAHLTTTATSAGTVSAHIFFDNQDGGFGWWTVEDPTYLINGVEFFIGGPDFLSTWEGDVSFTVEAGDSFGFGVHSADCDWGPGVIAVSNFVFTPPEWQDLGSGLSGIDGVPTLAGAGSLVAGQPYLLSLQDAAPGAPAWLLAGTSQWNAPFKGGVLVPQPSVQILLVVNPFGRINLSGPWPAGIPSGIPLVIQYWIQDAAAPAGWSASNAVSATTS